MTKRKRIAKKLRRVRSLRRWAWGLGITTALAMTAAVLAKPLSPPRQPMTVPPPVAAPEAQASRPLSPPALQGRPEFSGVCSHSFTTAFAMPLGQGCAEGPTVQPMHTLTHNVCRGLRARVGTAPGPGACWVVALTDFAQPTAMSCTMCGGNAECVISTRDGVRTGGLKAPAVRFGPTGKPAPSRGASFSLDCV